MSINAMYAFRVYGHIIQKENTKKYNKIMKNIVKSKIIISLISQRFF